MKYRLAIGLATTIQIEFTKNSVNVKKDKVLGKSYIVTTHA